MTSFTIVNEVTTPQVLNTGESGVVTVNGNLMTGAQDTAVSMTDFAFLNVAGTILSQAFGIDSVNNAYVSVAASGAVIGNTTAIHIAGATFASTVNNRGLVYGATAILSDSGPLTILNAGQITGDAFAAISTTGTGLITVTNSGDIFGGTYGILTAGTSTATITNTGVISGITGALSLANGVSVVLNTGTLGGKSLLGGGADVFNGTVGVQGSVYGGAGADKILGGLGDDALFGDAGADVLRGGQGDDDLFGGADADQMFGGLGDDALSGGAGVDVLRGGEGDDRLTAGTQADTFVFTRGQGTDRITDFANGVDKIDLRAFDFANLAAVRALASATSVATVLRIDLPGEGMLFVQGLTLATLTAGDVLL